MVGAGAGGIVATHPWMATDEVSSWSAMELLARIVPAIRETRVPLITGYAWVFAGWLSAARIIAIVDPGTDTPEPWSLLWVVSKAFGVLGAFGGGAALTVVAFLVGSGLGYLWDQVSWRSFDFRPLDVRALRDRAARTQTEAQLRLQLAPPLALAGLVTATFGGRYWPATLGVGIAAVVVVSPLLFVYGRALWAEVARAPLTADLSGVDLSDAFLGGANCTHVNLSGADLRGSDLSRANLRAANVEKALLDDANLTRADLQEVLGLSDSQLRSIASVAEANMTKMVLRDTNLTRASLSEADLFGADLTGADLTGANLIGANLTVAYLFGADLTGALLSGADLSGANLTRADLSEAYLVGANLTGANLSGALLSEAYLFGADLVGANLTGANLSGANLDDDFDRSTVTFDERTTWPDDASASGSDGGA